MVGERIEKLREAVTGIDVHPVAVHLARAAWNLAARPAIEAAGSAGLDASLSIPGYLGDALQLRFRTGDIFAEKEITIQVEDEEDTEGANHPLMAMDDNQIEDVRTARPLHPSVSEMDPPTTRHLRGPAPTDSDEARHPQSRCS